MHHYTLVLAGLASVLLSVYECATSYAKARVSDSSETDTGDLSSALNVIPARLVEMLLSYMCPECLWGDEEGLVRIADGKRCCAIGRSARILTETIPRLHSPTESMRQGTL